MIQFLASLKLDSKRFVRWTLKCKTEWRRNRCLLLFTHTSFIQHASLPCASKPQRLCRWCCRQSSGHQPSSNQRGLPISIAHEHPACHATEQDEDGPWFNRTGMYCRDESNHLTHGATAAGRGGERMGRGGGGELQQRGEKKRHFCQLIICMFKKWNDENILNQYLVQKNHSQKGFKNFSLSARQRDSARHLATLPVNMSHPNITTLLTHKSRSQQRCTCSWSC